VYQSTPGRSLSEGLHSNFAPAQYFKARSDCPTPTPEEAIERFAGIVDVDVDYAWPKYSTWTSQLQRVALLQVFFFGVAGMVAGLLLLFNAESFVALGGWIVCLYFGFVVDASGLWRSGRYPGSAQTLINARD
jgi:hypothetical protein